MEKPMVRVLLASYNGANYIRQMIDSLLAQDYEELQIILSDDCSSDGTDAILAEYAAAYPDKVVHYCSGQRFACAQSHFMHLLSRFSDAPYIMFCDQDDIWHSDKVRLTLEEMLRCENDTNMPVLVHTDLRVVDKELNEISPSFCAHSGLEGSRLKLNRLLVQNVVTGCTVMINRSLAEIACHVDASRDMMMHDWWLALLAAACGKVCFLNQATIDYRQHGANAVGAKNVYSPGYLLGRLKSGKSRQSMKDAARQAQAFLNCFGDLLDPEAKEMVEAFASTADAPLLTRDRIYIKYGLLKNGFPRVAAQLLGL